VKLLPLDEIVFTAEPHAYHWRGKAYPSVTQVLTTTLGDDFADVPQDRLEFCQGRGNAVHAAGAFLMAGDLDWDTVDPRIEGYVRAVERFHQECPGKIVCMEKRMVSPGLGLAGTPDLVKFIRGRRSLIDYKTSQQMKPRMRLQTAGYQRLWETIYPNQPIYERYGLRLQPDGFYKLVPHEDPDDALAFEKIMRANQANAEAAPWVKKYA
jgi:hypothetical protein